VPSASSRHLPCSICVSEETTNHSGGWMKKKTTIDSTDPENYNWEEKNGTFRNRPRQPPSFLKKFICLTWNLFHGGGNVVLQLKLEEFVKKWGSRNWETTDMCFAHQWCTRKKHVCSWNNRVINIFQYSAHIPIGNVYKTRAWK
jgi:hypothetical protein